MSTLKFDVVVVGAGVAGLYAARFLGSLGWKVALIESKPATSIGDKVCGDAIGVHHFEELGLDIPSHVVDHKYRGVKIYSPSRRYSIVVPGEGISINRLKFGQWLLKEALDNGVQLYDQHVVVDVILKNDYVTAVKVKRVGGGTLEIEGEAFIDASGYRPALRSKLPPDWPISERPYVTDYNIAYREVIQTDEPLEGEDVDYANIYIDINVAPGGYWWLFPKSRDGRVLNIGLGVINSGEYNPRYQYEKHLRPLFRGRVLHAGGGVVPTRRPLPTLVWRNVASIGDAAYTVNPVHGGGIGSSMLAAHIVSKHMSSGLESGAVNEAVMWGANIDYNIVYGAKQAGLDVLRMYMQKLTNEDYEWIMENRIVDGQVLYDLGYRGDLAERILHSIATLIKLLGRPSLLNELRVVRSYMNKAKELYTSKYPVNPSNIHRWMIEVDNLFDEYARRIGFNRGARVRW